MNYTVPAFKIVIDKPSEVLGCIGCCRGNTSVAEVEEVKE